MKKLVYGLLGVAAGVGAAYLLLKNDEDDISELVEETEALLNQGAEVLAADQAVIIEAEV